MGKSPSPSLFGIQQGPARGFGFLFSFDSEPMAFSQQTDLAPAG